MRHDITLEDVESFVIDWYSKNHYGVSVRDVQRSMGFLSTSTAKVYVDKLVAQGRLRSTPRIPRSIIPAREVVEVDF